jgi:hypothetical protein
MHHAVNLLMHVTNTLLLLLLLVRMTNHFRCCVVVAALFALHPLRVESVAWAAERKDLLCALFFLLSLHAYVSYTRTRRKMNLIVVMLMFAFSLMAKPMSVTLPFVLFLLDWWPLQRFKNTSIRILLLEKLPFIPLVIASCVVTVLAQKSGGAVILVRNLDVSERLVNALTSYMLYLWEFLWPSDLAILYPLPAVPNLGLAVSGLIIIILTTIFVIKQRFSKPYLMFGWLWFMGMLVPVIGLVQVGVQSHADRYTYLPLIGCSIAFVWGAYEIMQGVKYGNQVLLLLTASALILFSIKAHQQVYVWRDSETVFRHALNVTSRNYVMHTNLGIALWNNSKHDEAIAEYRKAIAILPQYADQHFILATALLVSGKSAEAAEEYLATILLQPAFPHAHTNLGIALENMGLRDEAISAYREGLRQTPDDYKASENLNRLLN